MLRSSAEREESVEADRSRGTFIERNDWKVWAGISQIVVRAGGPLPKDTAIPLDWVRRIDETGIFVEVGAEQLAALPEAKPAQQVQPAGK